MLEIISPAGSPEGIIAAVQNGADAVYLGFGDLNARKNAKNFTKDELGWALEYCRVRGVKAYLALNSLAFDHELAKASQYAKEACRLGIDAIIVQDLGVMRAVRQSVPDVPVHASTMMGIHNLEGVKIAAAMGMKRAVLARELSRRKIAHICANSPIEIEVFVHGALCMCYSGQCYMSSVMGRKGDNRGQCAQPCRHSYSIGGHAARRPLSLKDCFLIRHLAELETMGVTAVKIEGRTRRPEYSAIVTGLYSKAAHGGKMPAPDDIRSLQKTFSRHGCTDGFYTGRQGADMQGARDEEHKAESVIFATARKNYLNGEYQRVPLRFVGAVTAGKEIKLAAIDDKRNTAVVYGPVPEIAFHRELTVAAMQTQLHKTGGTPFYCAGFKGKVEPGLSLTITAFNDMRRKLMSDILRLRRAATARIEGAYVPYMQSQPDRAPIEHKKKRRAAPLLTVSVMRADQLSREMERLLPHIVYIPVLELDFDSQVLQGFLKNEDITVAAVLPRVMHDNEKKKVSEVLRAAAGHGVTDALVGNIGHILFAQSHGMNARGDFGLNAFNSETLAVLKDLSLTSATLSFELTLDEIRDMAKPLDTEIIVYGRLPLMITENCIIKNSTGVCTCENFSGLTDRHGALYPVVPEFGCRNVLLNSKKLFMADKRRTISSLGVWAQRLSFTTENAIECAAVMERFMGTGDYETPGYTRGLYYRGVE